MSDLMSKLWKAVEAMLWQIIDYRLSGDMRVRTSDDVTKSANFEEVFRVRQRPGR